ncbi:MAG: hypothetical protein JNL28_01105 [Planctomycetes bacterium]|nr:hypothetical protein [Planctomycetota bacterium]
MIWNAIVETLAENTLLQRLCLATLEFCLLSVTLALLVRWIKFSSQRLVACLWLIVIAKPLVTLALGAPIVIFQVQAPAIAFGNAHGAAGKDTTEFAHTDERALSAPVTPDPAPVGRLEGGPNPAAEAASARGSRPTGTSVFSLTTLWIAAWGAGVLWCALRYARVRRQLAQLVRRSDPAPKVCRQRFAAIARETRVARTPHLRVSDEVDSPALIGLLEPTVLLPRRLVERGGEAATEWALRHELAHWRWRDPFAILLRDIVSVCFFFHPLLFWATRRHAEAMEMACDWESLRDPADAPDYAEGLCGILQLMQSREPQRMSGTSLAMATQGRMARRIRALLEGERARPLTPRSAFGVALLASAVLAVGCSVARDGATVENGASADAGGVSLSPRQTAVRDGLCWLARHQNKDGSWSATTLNDVCPSQDALYTPPKAYTKRFDDGLTGLALLGFLRADVRDDRTAGELVDATTGVRYSVAAIVEKGINWLVSKQKPDGSFSTDRAFMYVEALAGAAVAEAYARTRHPAWKDAAQNAMNFLQGAQRPNPTGESLWGWRYASRQEIEQFVRPGVAVDESLKRELYDSDTSVTAWCVMALRAGASAGLEVRRENLDGALAFTRWATAQHGMVGYIDPRGAGASVTGPNDHYTYHPAVMSALGLRTRADAGDDSDTGFRELAVQQIVKDMPRITEDRLSIDYYYWFHGVLALRTYDGPTKSGAEQWTQAAVTSLLALQDHTARACTHGGWMVPDRWSYSAGPLYTTALNVLTLVACGPDARPTSGTARK